MNKVFTQFAKSAIIVCIAAQLISSCKKDKTEPVQEPEYRKEILLSSFPNASSGSNEQKGQFLILSHNGDTIWKDDLAYRAHDFKRWIVNRNIRYSYTHYDPNLNPLNTGFAGTVIVVDKDFNEMQRIQLKPYNGRTEADTGYIDGHDFILIDDNHYIVMAYYTQKATNIPSSLNPNPNCKIIVSLIQEVKNGEVIWEWNSANYPELYFASLESNDFSNDTKPQDYLHINSMFIDPRDNNLICSFRNADQVLKINRGNGKIIWKLGGNGGDFPLASNQVFMRQHHATLVDNNETLLLFDNGLANKRPYSRILEFKLDETAKKVTGFKSYTLPAFCQYMGSVQKTDSTYFVGGGSTPKVWEISLKTGLITWQRDLMSNSYRAYKY